jgi:hypothetical protein
MKLEDEVQQLILLEAPKHHSILFRNNSGACKDETGRVIRYGLCNTSAKQNEKLKSSDLIGITMVVVTPDMVGKCLAVFTAIEVKREDWKPPLNDKRYMAQRNFIDFVISRGGLAGFANCVEKFKQIIGK